MVENQSKIAVLGIGNLIMQDEGVGIHVIRKLETEYIFQPEIELIDGGTSGSELYGFFEDNDKMIIVDAVNFDEEPGFIGTIEKDDILKRLNTKLSMHNLGLTDVLSHVKLLDIEPSEIFLVGIQPAVIELHDELSDVISKRVDRILEVVCMKLTEWNVSCEVRAS
ncbi:MAG: HyaD/HybD family hydrogenase maturation endopeptidase [Calditrichia bacterium]|nr:HyaD/HybD family hydrogenase maturation endopeptidase [Calditrichia bacterium]